MFATKRGETLHEGVPRLARLACELRPVHRRLAEHGVALVGVGDLVAGEEQGHAVKREHPHEHLVDRVVPPRLLAARSRIGGDVVVLVVIHEARADRALPLAPRPPAPHGFRAHSRKPAVVGVEALVLVADRETLAEQHGITAREAVHHVVRVAPEVERDAVAHVAAETVRAEIPDERLDVVHEVGAQARRGEVELREAPRAFLHGSVGVPPRELGMLLQERRGRSAVEVDEVEDDLHPQPVRLGAEILQVLVGTVLLVDVEVVGDAVLVLRVVEAAPNLARTPEALVHVRVHLHHRHEIGDRDAEVLQVRQLRLRGGERTLRRERARLDLVHHAAREPFRRLPRLLHPRVRPERLGCNGQDRGKNRQPLTLSLLSLHAAYSIPLRGASNLLISPVRASR